MDSAHADFTPRCYDWRDRAPFAARVYVSEGDQFVINVLWHNHSASRKLAVEWNTRRGSGGTATSDTDYEPRDDFRQTRRSTGDMNHTFSTIEDDRYVGDEMYEAGYSFANGSHDIDRHEYCPVTIEDDDDLKVDGAWISSTPADGRTYRAGEWIEIAAKFNGRAAVEGDNFLAFLFHSSGGFQSRKVDYRRGSGTDTLVFGYQVDVRDRNVDYEVQPNYIQGDGRLYGVWTNGAHHRENTANRIMPDGYGEELSVDGRRYVRSVSVTSQPRVGDTYGAGREGRGAGVLGRVVDPRQGLDHLVRHNRPVAERMEQLRHHRMVYGGCRHLPEPGNEVLVDHQRVELRRRGATTHRHVVLHVARRQLAHRGPARELPGQRLRHRVLARPDPQQDVHRPEPRLLGRGLAVVPDCHPPGRFAALAGLHGRWSVVHRSAPVERRWQGQPNDAGDTTGIAGAGPVASQCAPAAGA